MTEKEEAEMCKAFGLDIFKSPELGRVVRVKQLAKLLDQFAKALPEVAEDIIDSQGGVH